MTTAQALFCERLQPAMLHFEPEKNTNRPPRQSQPMRSVLGSSDRADVFLGQYQSSMWKELLVLATLVGVALSANSCDPGNDQCNPLIPNPCDVGICCDVAGTPRVEASR